MDFLNDVFSMNGGAEASIWMSLLAMLIATILSLIITKVYQITFTGERYSQAFVHTIIMMSVIVSFVMNMISGDAGVAFFLFVVFSFICFVCAVKLANDIAYIFFGLCVGMAAGLYHFDLAILLTLFASSIFYLLFKLEYGKGKDTQILKVTVPENLNHENMLDDLFHEFTESHVLRQVETTNLGTMILYTYTIRSKNDVKEKDILDQIREKNANLKVSLTYLESSI